MALFTKEEALEYHSIGRKGKVEVVPVKPCVTQKHLSMAYSPGVAEACMAIHADPEKVYEYTGKGNLVGVVSNGTAVLGLGNIGPEAGKPVMEGKGVLFKVFGDVDVYDIDLNVTDPDELCEVVKALEPTFGGINLEDIKAPECFYIEEKLKKEMNIPVFHDDQHGTAIVTAAGMMNAIEISGKDAADMRVVISGAGAAAIACTNLYRNMGVKFENIAMFDSKGHINKSRTDLNEFKQQYATEKAYASLAEAMVGADCFLGLSKAGVVSKEMVKSMSDNCPIIFACANPDPEISYTDAKEARPDCIMGTGRSDFPNQVNNVLGFPFIFRGALDCGAYGHYRGDEAGRRPGPGRPGQDGGPGIRLQGVRRGQARIRPRLRHSQGPGPAAHRVRVRGRGQGGHGGRRGPQAARPGRIQEVPGQTHCRLLQACRRVRGNIQPGDIGHIDQPAISDLG